MRPFALFLLLTLLVPLFAAADVEIAKPARLIVQPRLSEAFLKAHPDARLASVALRSCGGTPEIRRQTQIDGDREIVFDGLRAGPYELLAIVSIPENTQPIELATVDLEAGEQRRLDDILEPLVFRGRVISGDEGAEMQLSIWGDLGGRPSRSKPTGEFVILLPKAGTYSVQGVPVNARQRAIELGAIEFNDPRKPIELRVPRGVVEVTVTDRGKPARGAEVYAALQLDGDVYTGPAPRVTLDESGQARFDSLLEGRTWLIEARGGNGRIAEQTVTVRDGEPVRIALELQQPVMISGAISDSKGEPVTEARVGCLYLSADDVPRLTASERQGGGRYAVKLASAPASDIRCGVRASTIGMLTSAPSKSADFHLLPAEKSGSLVITNWRHTVRTRNTLWLANAAGDVFNLDWVGNAAGPVPAPLTIDGLPEGRWRIVRVKSMANLAALARGDAARLPDVAAFTIEPGEKAEIAIDFD